MFKTLAGVSYNGGPTGQAFGGGIYSISCDIGTSQEPTKITLNIVSPNGTYAIGPQHLNVTSGGAKTIQVGSGVNVLTFNNMYVYKYNYNQTASSKTLAVTLIDHSVALDKVFVGLVGRHSSSLAVPTYQNFQFTVDCTECNTLWPDQVSIGPASVTKLLWQSPNGGPVSGPGGIDGGYIIMGMEQWTDGNCEIPKVEYTYTELLSAVAGIGYDVTSLTNFNRSTFYQASYTGTLRDVLNAWASDFSFSFSIDPTVPNLRIIGTDLTTAVDLTNVRNALNGAGFTSAGGANAMIRSRSDSLTLENTYRQEPIVKNIKAARSFTRNQINYMPMPGVPVSVVDAIGYTAHLGRTNYQMKVSIALAKYKPEARMLWLSDQAAQGGAGAAAWPSLGFIPASNGEITDQGQKQKLLSLFKESSSSGAGSPFQHPIWDYPANYKVFIGVWNEAYQGAMEGYDAELADFYNKYGYWYGQNWAVIPPYGFVGGAGMTNPPPSFRNCPDFADPSGVVKWYDYAAKMSTLPETKYYKGGAYPFQDILRSNAGAFALTASAGGGFGGADTRGDGIFEIADNAWGTHQEHIEQLFANKWVLDTSQANNWDPNLAPQSSLDHFLPIYARFDSDQVMDNELRQILPNFKMQFVDPARRKEGYFPGVAIVPILSNAQLEDPLTGTTQKILEIGSIISQTNGVAYDNTRRRRLEMVGDAQKDCKIYCEEDIVSDLCECPTLQDPLHKFAGTYLADAFVVKHLGSWKTIIFPIGENYIGYWKSDVTFRGTYPKEIDILGAPASPAGNVMETRVIDVDVTQEMNPPAMGIHSNFVVRNTLSATPITLAQYYAQIASMNQQSFFPGETINVKLDGIEFDGLITQGLLNPAAGMVNFNVSMDAEGMSTDLTFSSRVPKMPKRDVWLQQVGPRATQGRTGGAPRPQVQAGSNSNSPFPW